MDKSSYKYGILFRIIIAVLIIFSPAIITGRFSIDSLSGNLLITEFIIRTVALIIGLLLIYFEVKNYFDKFK